MTQTPSLHRRRLLASLAGLLASGAAASRIHGQSQETESYVDTVSVLAPILPDPAPPERGSELFPGLERWETRNQASVKYETAAVENIKAKILLNFSRGAHLHDLMYCAGWAPELSAHLLPIDPLIDSNLRADLAGQALQSFRWDGKTWGLPIVSNPMILFANQTLLDRAGMSAMPADWDSLVATAAAIKRTGISGWTMAGGQIGGLGGLFTNWNLFFLQAGGEMFDPDGRPDIANDSGVAAIEMLRRLLEHADSSALEQTSILEATVAMMQGRVGLMANWAVMYRTLSDPRLSEMATAIATAELPMGPMGTASVDSGDGWTIDGRTWIPIKSVSLVRYFLEPGVQRRLFDQTGWLPASRTALSELIGDPAAPHAAAVQAQMSHRINSGFRPDYDVVSGVIGNAVRTALVDGVLPIIALRTARDQLLARRT